MIDWNQPELTKEAVVREAVSHLTFRNEEGLWMSYDAGVFMFSGITRAEMWSAVYDGWPKVQAYVAAHRTQEAPAEAQERDWSEDFSHENGNYENKCCVCKSKFIGHKRRAVCKLCDAKPNLTQPTHSAAERERAYSQLGPTTTMTDLQCALNAANARIEEARKLLGEYRESHRLHYECFDDETCMLCDMNEKWLEAKHG